MMPWELDKPIELKPSSKYVWHDSIRGAFAKKLYERMCVNPRIFLLTADLGYKMFDPIKSDFPERFIDVNASEQTMLDMAVGLAYSSKIPVCYSITPFLMYRAWETVRTYVNHENLNVKMCGSGRDSDYEHDGYSHNATDVKVVMASVPNVTAFYPNDKTELGENVREMLSHEGPYFLSLKR